MTFPETIDARWIDSLSDQDLLHAEWRLRALFSRQETREKARRGAAYALLQGPEALTSAWMRWSLVSTAARARGLHARYRS